MDIRDIPLDQIHPPKLLPRLEIDQAGLEELAASIKRHDLISPLTVTPDNEGYRLLAGNRRYHALQMLGRTAAPCNVVTADPAFQDEITIVENLLRRDLTPLEEAYAFALYLNQSDDSQGELAQKLGQERTYVTRRLLLLDLDDITLGALQEGIISLSQALLLRRIDDPTVRQRFITHAHEFGANVRTMQYWVANWEKEQARAQAAQSEPDVDQAFAQPRQTFMACDRCAIPTAYDILRPVYTCAACRQIIASHQALQLMSESKESTQ